MRDPWSISLTILGTFLKRTLKTVKGLTVPVVLPSRFSKLLEYTQLELMVLQGQGGLLIRKIEGDYHNVVGFPAASFFRLLDLMVEEDDDFLAV
jgi:hypothetical protein